MFSTRTQPLQRRLRAAAAMRRTIVDYPSKVSVREDLYSLHRYSDDCCSQRAFVLRRTRTC
jgi:hypothetical protein